MKRSFGFMVICCFLILMVIAQSMVFGAPKKIRLALSLENLGNPFYATLKNAAIEEARKQKVDITVLGVPFSTDIESQVRILEDFTAKKVDVIGYAAVDAKGIVAALQKAKNSGIPIICVDTKAEWDGDTTYISTDNTLGGFYAGVWLANAIGGKGKIGIIEGAPSTVNDLRKEGFFKALKMYPEVKVAVQVPANWRRDMGLSVTEDVLTGNPDIEGIFYLNDEMALGGLQAINTRKLQDKIKTIGYNGSDEAIQEVYKGRLGADIIQFPEVMGREFVRNAIKLINGQKLPKYINSGVAVIDTVMLQKTIPVCLQKDSKKKK